MKKLLTTIIIFSLSLPVYAQQNFKLTASVLGSGGTKANNSLYGISGTIGQSAIGASTGSSYKQLAGFWQAQQMLVTDVGEESENILPTEYKLKQNYPNPFNPGTKIRYSIPPNITGKSSNVKLILYDVLGREIETLVNETQQAGNYEINFNASNYASGVYLYRITAGTSSGSGQDFVQTKKMVILK